MRILMLITCTKCGHKFQINECGTVCCPNCGNEQIVAVYDKTRKTDMPTRSKYVHYFTIYENRTVNSAIKVLLAFAIVLVVFTTIRLISSVPSILRIENSIKHLEYIIRNKLNYEEFVGSADVKTLVAWKKLLPLAYAEAFMHAILFVFSVFVFACTIKAKQYGFSWHRTMIFSIIMLALIFVYAIIEAMAIDIGFDSGIMSGGIVFGAWMGVMIIMISSIICLEISHKLFQIEKHTEK